MQDRKIMVVLGTRPEAIKLAAVIKRLGEEDAHSVVVVSTGQHKEMLNDVLTIFKIHPQYRLDVMIAGQSLPDLLSNIVCKLDAVVKQEKPDFMFVQGDTATAYAASLVGFLNRVRVGHVEAGLRSFDKFSPFPEETFRRLTGVLTDVHFAPTETAKQNLLNEGVTPEQICVTGNTVIDALFTVLDSQDVEVPMKLQKVPEDSRVVVITAHRRENLNERLAHICRAVSVLSMLYPKVYFVYPMHPNPRVREPVHAFLDNIPNVLLLEPLKYDVFVALMNRAYLMLTDSGGIQEEAPALGKPVLVLREETERPEAMIAGTVKLIGTDTDVVIKAVSLLLDDEEEYWKMAKAVNPYGDGHAAERIALKLYEVLKDGET